MRLRHVLDPDVRLNTQGRGLAVRRAPLEDTRMKTFKALRIHRDDGRIQARFDDIGLDDLSPGEVVVRVGWSGINYKDALAATGTAPILRRYPLVGGIDFAGEVVTRLTPTPGQKVLVTGCGLSKRGSGCAEYAHNPGD
jgi:NADPH:quinone reductase-like Zn-dependent oxidoreductase